MRKHIFYMALLSMSLVPFVSMSQEVMIVDRSSLGLQLVSEYNVEDIQRVRVSRFEDLFGTASYCPDGQHPHLVDLGLPSGTIWSCCNTGASKPEELGGSCPEGEADTESLPSDVQFQELLEVCQWKPDCRQGVLGWCVIGPNGRSIFLPIDDGQNHEGLDFADWQVHYLTSSADLQLEAGAAVKKLAHERNMLKSHNHGQGYFVRSIGFR